jgi:deaminated glutathione amidase
MPMTRIAAIQMNSGADVDANLALAGSLLADAAADACTMAVLPENFALMPVRSRDKAHHAEEPGQGPIQEFLANAARQHRLWIVAGSLPLESPEAGRVYGACVVIDAQGATRAIYRKIHLFDVDLADTRESYRESNSMFPGSEPVTVETPAGKLGLTICYDLRFPEQFRRYVADEATIFTVPAAFTAATGKAHWRILLAARAIENLAYVVAPGQWGQHPDGRTTWGHTMIVDPWGTIIGELPDGNGIVTADIDTARVHQLRREFPALDNRKLK